MKDRGCGEPWLCDGVHAWPWHAVALTTSAQRLTPIPHDGVAEYPEQAALARDGLVSIRPHQHALEPSPLLRDGPVPAPPQRVLHGPQLLAEPLGHRLAPDRALSLPRFTTDRRKAEKVESLRCALRTPRAPFDGEAAQLAQARFLRMPLQIALSPTCPQCSPAPVGGVPVCDAHDAIVGVAHDAPIAACVLPPPSVGPQGQDLVPVDMRRHGAHTAPLGGPFLLRVPWSFFQHARVPPLLHVAHDALGPHPLRAALHQPGVVQRVQEPTEVRLKPPVAMALLQAHRHRLERLMGAATRSTSLVQLGKNTSLV
jgi:hypothetical protein